jgi:cytolysin (calcineurin-like family phosphatase)
MTSLPRREFLAASLASACALARADERKADERLDLAFFFVADTHYLADVKDTKKLDKRSADTTSRLVDQLNKLPGTAIPDSAGGGKVAAPRGVIHGGDVIDSGDRNTADYLKMQQTEWASYVADFGLDGKDGRLAYPVYEIHGNHDSPQGDGLVVKKIAERNKKRPGVVNVSKNGLHYSWDWKPVHFVSLGIVVGPVKSVKRKRRYNPLDSLDFLIADLKENVGDSGRPVVLTHHVDVARNATGPNSDAPSSSKEWDPADVRGYHDALKAYNVIAVLYGHTHSRAVFRWDGTTKKADKGVPVFNVAKSAHFSGKDQAVFHFHLRDGEMVVRELRTTDRWETAAWTPQTWKSKVAVAKGK